MAAERESLGVTERIMSLLLSLPPAERAAAQFIAEHADEVPYLTITELARRASVSQATVHRCVQSLGYEGYTELRIALSREVGAKKIFNIPGDIQEGDEIPAITEKVASAALHAIAETQMRIEAAAIARAVELILGARNLIFYGIGGSGNVARTCAHLFMKAGFNAVAHTDPYMQMVAASLATAHDVVIAISQSGVSLPVVRAARAAKKAGASVIALAGSRESELGTLADVFLPTYSREQPIYGDLIEAKFSQLYVASLLYIAFVTRYPRRVQESLERTAEAVHAFLYEAGFQPEAPPTGKAEGLDKGG